MSLTPKQELFCQKYVELGNASEAYRQSYNASKMKSETINVKSSQMLKESKISIRIKELQTQLEEDNRISKNKIVKELTSYIMLDPKEIYNDLGEIKPLEELKPETRRALSEVGVKSVGGGECSREVKFAKTYDKLKAIDMLSKMLGYYIPDRSEVVVSESSELPSWFKGSKK